jgi:hypothetical protein
VFSEKKIHLKGIGDKEGNYRKQEMPAKTPGKRTGDTSRVVYMLTAMSCCK